MTAPPGPAHLPLAVDGNGELHDTRDIESAPGSLVGPLRCADCGAPLEAVRAYPRRERATIIHVAAHYRLAPGATHTTTCPAWTQPSSAAPPASPGVRSPVAPLVYSLVVPGRGDRRAPVWRSRSYRRKGLPALNSAAKVADILTRHGNDAAGIRLDYRGRLISWHDFLFPCADAERLAQLLQQGRPGHPVAVVGRLGDRDEARCGRSHFAVLTDPSVPPTTPAGGPRVVLRATNEELLGAAPDAQLAVALGWWQLHASPGKVPDDLVLWINRSWQISTPSRTRKVGTGAPETPGHG